MGSPYQRQDVSNNIANGNIINADDLDAEFDALETAFAASTGHSHDGTTGEGGPITVVGPAQDLIISGTQVTPKVDNTLDLGSSSFEFKDLWLDGTANIDSLVADTADINGGTADAIVIGASTPAAATFTTMAASSGTIAGIAITTLSNTQTLTNKTIDLTNNTLIATSAQLAAAVTDETGTGALVFAGSPALTGTPTAPTAAAGTNTTQVATTAHVFAERTNTATLTNKTLTSPTVNDPVVTGGSINNTPIGGTTRNSGAFTTLDANGNVVLGDASGDTVTVNGTATFVNGGVGVGGSANAAAQLDIQSTTKGFLPPRMTTAQRDAIASPVNGLIIFNTDFNRLEFYVTSTTSWEIVGISSSLAGRNRIINGQGRINQRGYVSGTNTSGANEYTLDRWRVVTSGQSLTFTGDNSKRTMTAPAGGVEQVIEGANIEGGTYVLNWAGTATATVNGTARTKGETFTLTANTNATVRFSSGTFTDVQLELGSTPTAFERLPLSQELANCERYYQLSEVGYADETASANTRYGFTVFSEMRVAPSVTNIAALGAQTNVNSSTFSDITVRGLRADIVPTASGAVIYRRSLGLNSEI